MSTDPSRTRRDSASPVALRVVRGGPGDVHVVADSDTRWKWGAAVAHRLQDGPVRVHAHLLEGRATPSPRQLADVGLPADRVHRGDLAEVLAELAASDADVVVLACVGGTIQALLQGLARAWHGRAARPVVVTGYVGVVYERVVDGLLLRAGADLLLANSPADERRFREVLAGVGADPDSVVRTALPFLDGAAHDPTAAGRTRPFTVTFVAQPSVPVALAERRYMARELVEHARRWPQRQVVVKLRGRPGEQTTHLEPHPYARLIAREVPPRNLELVHGAMAPVLDRTDLCVTVSSTVALEAMHRGIPTAVLTDVGVRESAGNHFFVGSGALTSWPALHSGAIPKTDQAWAADNGVGDPDPWSVLQQRTGELVAARDHLPPLRPWLTVDAAAGYLPALLARHGLDSDGTTAHASPAAQAVRHGLRLAARRAYQAGVTRIEPRLRQWGGAS